MNSLQTTNAPQVTEVTILEGGVLKIDFTPSGKALSFRSKSSYTVFLDPATWVAIAKAVAAIASSYLSGKDEEARLDRLAGRIEQAIAAAVEELKRFIVEALDQSDIRKFQASMDAVMLDLEEFQDAPKTSGFRIDNATVKSSELMLQLKSLGLKAFGPVAQAIGLHILVLTFRYKCFKEDGALISIKNCASRGRAHMQPLLDEVMRIKQASIDGVGEISRTESCSNRPTDGCFMQSFFMDNGTWRSRQRSYNKNDEPEVVESYRKQVEAEISADRNARLDVYRAAYVETEQSVIAPVMAVMLEWDEAARIAGKL